MKVREITMNKTNNSEIAAYSNILFVKHLVYLAFLSWFFEQMFVNFSTQILEWRNTQYFWRIPPDRTGFPASVLVHTACANDVKFECFRSNLCKHVRF